MMKIINRKIRISFIQLIVGLCFLTLSLSLSQAEVTLTFGDGSGIPGATSIPIAVSLENPNHKVKGVEVLIQDVDDYLVFSECETTDRSAGFDCLGNEITELPPYEPEEKIGCAHIYLFDMDGEALIEEGTGPICWLTFQVKSNAPLGDCRDFNIVEELEGYVYTKVLDENMEPLDLTLESGEFCFEPLTTTSTTAPTTTTARPSSTTTVSATTTSIITTTTTTTTEKSIEISPSEVMRSRWIPLFRLMDIKGTGTNFELFKTFVDYDSISVIKLPALILSPENIFQIIMVMPSLLTGIGFDGESETVTVTVDGVSDTFEVKMLPAPFDEKENLM